MKQLCSICHENEAVLFVRIYSANKEEEKGLCPSCAVKYLQDETQISEFSFVDEKLVHVIDEMKNLLSGIVTNISEMVQLESNSNQSVSLICPSCGISYEDFRQTGLLGCPQCYDTFQNTLDDLILELHRGSQHRGKMPDQFARFFVLKKEVYFLNNQLKKLLHSEDYEKADLIKKKLERLIGKQELGREDENH